MSACDPFISFENKNKNKMNLVHTIFKKRVISLHGHEFTNNRQKGKFEDIPFQLFTERNKSLNQRLFFHPYFKKRENFLHNKRKRKKVQLSCF